MTAGFLRWLVQTCGSRERNWRSCRKPRAGCSRSARSIGGPLRCVIEQALKTGDFKVSHIFPLLPTRYVSETELHAAGFSPDIFRNINTPAEYEAVSRRAQLRDSGK